MAPQVFTPPKEIPKTQRAMVFDKTHGPIQLKEIPVPEPAPDQILVNVRYSGVCHTDLHAWHGDWPLDVKLPLVGGHEGAGVVVKVGSGVPNFKVGDYAGIKWLNGSCGACEMCKKSYESNCPHAVLSGYTIDGTFQQYALARGKDAAPIPKGTDLAQVAPILCAGITVYKAIKEADLQAGDWVAITGAGGGLGSLAIQYAKAMGLMVIGIDGGAEKEALATSLGCDVFIDFTKVKDLKEAIISATDGGPHGVVNVAAAEKPINQSCQYVRSHGTVVLVGLPANAYVHAEVFDVVVRSITIRGSYVGNRADSDEAIRFFSRGQVSIPIKVVGLEELPKIYAEMEKGAIAGRYVVDLYK